MRYFPANNREVSEIVTENGRMLVLNIADQNVPSSSTATPPYESISDNHAKPTEPILGPSLYI